MKQKPLIVGNWKMHRTTSDAIKLVTELKSKLKAVTLTDTVVAPPFTALSSVEIALQGSQIKLAAQNVHHEDEGAFTGEISVAMLRDVGCEFALVGHSERRRHFQESNDFLNRKVKACLHGDLMPIYCVGETLEQRKGNRAFAVVEEQIRRGTTGLTSDDIAKMVIAYEPVWAIGTGEVATPAQAQEIHQFIRDLLSKTFDKPAANDVRLLYGGSVNPENCVELMKQPDVNGLLVGGASLDAFKFSDIITSVGEIES